MEGGGESKEAEKSEEGRARRDREGERERGDKDERRRGRVRRETRGREREGEMQWREESGGGRLRSVGGGVGGEATGR